MEDKVSKSSTAKPTHLQEKGLYPSQVPAKASSKSEVRLETNQDESRLYKVAMTINEIQSGWKKLNFDYSAEGSTFFIKNYSQIRQISDINLTMIKQISQIPEAKVLQGKVTQWTVKLEKANNILTELEKCQRQWKYLQTVIDGEEIDSRLSEQKLEFKKIDAFWRELIDASRRKGIVMEVCSQEDMLEKLQEVNLKHEVVIKKLENSLENIRQRFPRFYFLSNDDLLWILSRSKNPRSLRLSDKGIFDSINSLDFDEQDRIIALNCLEEKLKLIKPVETKDRKLEEWLQDLQNVMKISVKKSIQNFLLNEPKDISELLEEHTGQTIETGSQIINTGDVEKCLENGGKSMEILINRIVENMESFIKLIQTKLSPQKRKILSNLIKTFVHNKDIVSMLKNKNSQNTHDFQWNAQLRTYWSNNECFVHCTEAKLSYCYEYLANYERIAITPLSDRCFITCMTAMKLNIGAVPHGPAGAGKTQTVKDLSTTLGQRCVVFNCSDQFDYLVFGKCLKGIASSGCWGCFDEFNRIDIEVLSSIAQQLHEIFREKERGSLSMNFEGSKINLKPQFGVFLTMNPGYAGRTQLPDNLKALFLPCAMMVPDYALISQINLYIEGFKNCSSMARKTVNTFKLSSEQLSQQDHYDFGMRAVMSVIRSVSKLRREDPEMSDEQLLLKSLRNILEPKMVGEDVQILNHILLDLFPGVDLPKRGNSKLIKKIQEKLSEKNLQPFPQIIEKVLELHDTLHLRHSNMLIGLSGNGKTTILKTLAETLEQVGEYKVHIHTINPKTANMDELYGFTEQQTSQWQDGIISKTMRKCAQDDSDDKHWIVFDGPIDALWVEHLNSVMDDNKRLGLPSGQMIMLKKNTQIFFELEDVAVASPATVSRNGMVFVQPEMLKLQYIFESWYQNLPSQITQNIKIMKKLKELKDIFVTPILNELRQELNEEVETLDGNLCQSLTKVLDTIFSQVNNEDFSEKLEHSIEEIYLFAVIWSLCCTTDLEGRKHLNNLVRKIIDNKLPWIEFPNKGSIYDYRYNIEDNSFVHWQKPNKALIDPSLQYSDVIIPTAESNRTIYFLKMLITNGNNALSCGPAGIGKSSNIRKLLTSELSEEYQYVSLPFSTQTRYKRVKENIMSKLEKVKGNLFRPQNSKKCILFVDDINMPKKQVYGAMPPCEVIRQCMDNKIMYKQNGQLMKLQNLTVLATMETSRGLSRVSNRLLRHFNVMTDTEFGKETMTTIFSQLLSHFHQGFSPSVTNIHSKMVEAGISIYQQTRSKLTLTKMNPHYDFHFRDIWKVFKGICGASAQHTHWAKDAIRLWYNENMRIYHDRLSCEEDRITFRNIVDGFFPDFGFEKEEVMTSDRTVFGRFSSKGYKEVEDFSQLTYQINEKQEECHQDSEFSINKIQKREKIALFEDATEHITRITRAIQQQRGNALVLGSKCLGSKSISRMAAYLAEFLLFQVDSSENYNFNKWRQDLKTILMKVGLQNKDICFLVSDDNLTDEKILEDINDILNGEEFAELYSQKDMNQIFENFKKECVEKDQEATEDNTFAQYISRIKNKLHMIVVMNPNHQKFGQRIKIFPSFTKCCTIDWISEWPEEALKKVAQEKLSTIKGGESSDFIEAMKNIHQNVEEKSVLFNVDANSCLGSSAYLNFIDTYKKLNSERGDEKVERQPAVQPKEQIPLSVRKMSEKQQEILEEEKLFEESLDKNEIDSDLQEVLTQFEHSIKEVENFNADCFRQLKALSKPPQVVKTVLTGLVILFKCKPIYVKVEGKSEIDYWDMAKHLMADPRKLKEDMLRFDKDNVSQATLAKIKDMIIENNDCTEERVKNSSSKCLTILQWIKSVYSYCKIKGNNKVSEKHEEKVKIEEPKDLPIEKIEEKEQDNESLITQSLKEVEKSVLGILSLDKGSITELKSFSNPPQIAVTVLSGLIILFESELRKQGCKIIYSHSKGQTKKEINYFEMSKKYLMNNPANMINMMVKFDTNNVSKNTLKKLKEQVFSKNELSVQKVKKVSFAASNMFSWLKSIYDYCLLKLSQQEVPKKENYVEQIEKQQSQKPDVLIYTPKEEEIKKPFSLVKNREYKNDMTQGDLLLYASLITYGGIFSSKQRSELQNDWQFILRKCNISFSSQMNLRSFFGNQMIIETWINELNLPNDRHSIENAIIVEKSSRKMLIVDPQNQVSQFVDDANKRKRENGDEQIEVTREMPSSMLTNTSVVDFTLTYEKVEEQLIAKMEPRIAERASILFFCLQDLSSIDYMYQYTFDWFKEFCLDSLDKINPNQPTEAINTELTFALKQKIEPSLFSKHRLAFTFLLTARIVFGKNALQEEELRMFLTGYSGQTTLPANPTSYIDEHSWSKVYKEIYVLSTLKAFEGLEEYFMNNSNQFKKIYQSNSSQEKLPQLPTKLNEFQKILLLKALRPDNVIPALKKWIVSVMGESFLSSSNCNIDHIFSQSAPKIPILLNIGHRCDPKTDIIELAEKKSMSSNVVFVPMGQGKGPLALKEISSAISRGNWVVLQNCHQHASWMPSLEKQFKNIQKLDKIHNNFRLWIVTESSEKFPVSVLERCVKLVKEPAETIRENLSSIYKDMKEKDISRCKKQKQYKKLLFALANFHAAILDRRNYAQNGWNIAYEWSRVDFEMSRKFFIIMLNEYEDIPFSSIHYMIAQIFYGGRVTDCWDRLLINTITKDYFNPNMMKDGYKFSKSGLYYSHEASSIKEYGEYIESLPLKSAPEAVGMDKNMSILLKKKQLEMLTSTISSIKNSYNCDKENEKQQKVEEILAYVESNLPCFENIEKNKENFPMTYEKTLNLVLVHEVRRYNRLIHTVKTSIEQVRELFKKGKIVERDWKKFCQDLLEEKIPERWQRASFPCLKSLNGWIEELKRRVNFFQKWIDFGVPATFDLNAFTFPQGFLTAVLQSYSRKNSVAVEKLSFKVNVMKRSDQEEFEEGPENGVYIRGLYLEGARWDIQNQCIAPQLPRQTTDQLPLLHFIPTENNHHAENCYMCLMYKTQLRKGVLSTTGHSTNFVMQINLPSSEPKEVCIKNRVAAFLSLRQ